MSKMRRLVSLFSALITLSMLSPLAAAVSQQGSWQPLTTQPSFETLAGDPGGAAVQWLLTDGTVLTLIQGSNEVWLLTPDSYGSYVNGEFTQLPPYPDFNGNPFSPFACATAVLADGRIIFAGGESNLVDDSFVESSLVAIYDPFTNSWSTIDPPSFCMANPNIIGLFDIPGYEPNPASSLLPAPYIGDAASIVLEDGTYMLSCCWCDQSALLNLGTMTWSPTGGNKNGTNHEEGWTLLPSGEILVVDLYVGHDNPPSPSHQVGSELYCPSTGKWRKGPDLVHPITEIIYVSGGPTFGASGSYPYPDHEVGPSCLRPDGTVIAFGGASTGRNAIYNVSKNQWFEGPTFPYVMGQGQLSMPDAPAALLPSGNVLVAASPYFDPLAQMAPAYFFELTLDDNQLIPQPVVPNAATESAGFFLFLTLPTGQVISVDGTNDVEIYTPGNQRYKSEWAPKIKKHPKSVTPGNTYEISGIRFNGMSQGAMYGDDYQNATNFPLVRITNNATGHVFYCRTHDHSFMGVASNKLVNTYFDVPAGIETGSSIIEVVVNGIPSKSKSITIN